MNIFRLESKKRTDDFPFWNAGIYMAKCCFCVSWIYISGKATLTLWMGLRLAYNLGQLKAHA